MCADVDILVIGAGPAGLSAALEAAKLGADVTIIDENLRPGGQLFKQIHKFFGSKEHRAGIRGFNIGEKLLEETKKIGVDVKLGYPVYGIFEGNEVLYGTKDGVKSLNAKKIIIATGANENNLCFEGSVLPGVMTAGAAQTMINIYKVCPGKKVVMIGSGNVGLIVSYQLLQAGADVKAVIEAAPGIGGYDVHANKLKRAGVPFYLSHTVVRAEGKKEVERVIVSEIDSDFKPIEGTEKVIEADTVCMAVGLTPMVELAYLGGCEMVNIPTMGGIVPMHSRDMLTTNKDIYVAGDVVGIEEASTAMEEGKVAGIAAAESLCYISHSEAKKIKDSIHSRLDTLRSGPFGIKRAEAKANIEKTYEEWLKEI